MKFIATPSTLRSEFRRLMRCYRHFDWAVAWATTGFPAYEALIKHSSKIHRLIVGTHFHQTAPDFIEAFAETPNVRFRLDQDGLNGVFHPKLYLFSNSPTDWEAVVGSANFTNGAFFRNVEHAVVIGSDDHGEGLSYESLSAEIEHLWNNGRKLSAGELESYRLRWRNNRQLLDKVSGHTRNNARPRSIYDCSLLRLSWDEYLQSLHDVDDKYFDDRIAILKASKRLWIEKSSLTTMTVEERKQICGTASEKVLRWRLFGSMRGAFILTAALRDENVRLLASLDQIPLSGEIHREHYVSYIKELRASFEGDKEFEGLAVASRLLCLRRPDYFVCVDRKDREGLLGTLGVSPGDVTLDSYWETIVEPLRDTRWWQSSPPPSSSTEHLIWSARIAMVDALFYKE